MPPRCSRTLPPPNSYTLSTRPSRNSRSWLTMMAVPSNALIASFSTSFDCISRWLVGSSRMSRFTGSSSSLIIANRLRSPPLSTLTYFSDVSPPNMKAPSRSFTLSRISPVATLSMVWKMVRFSSSSCAWFWAK